MRKIAFVGSRKWLRPQEVALQMNSCFNEHGQFILVSGGADGPSTVAEKTGMEFGLPIISFRPVKIADEVFAVDEWRLFKGVGKIVQHRDPTFTDWVSAATYRSMLIAERADEGFAFWDGHSQGTSDEIAFFEAEATPLMVIR